MIDWSKPVRKIGGLEMKVLSTEASGDYPVVVDEGNGRIWWATLDGRMVTDGDVWFENIPQERFVWLNVYKDGSAARVVHATRNDADVSSDIERAHVLRINPRTGETVKELN
jgi:hypothetical protein